MATTRNTRLIQTKGLLAAGAIALCDLASVPSEGDVQPVSSTLTVTLTGFKSTKGVAAAAVYRSAAGFPGDGGQAAARATAPIENGRATLVFRGLPPGRYAVAAFHDENANGKLDKNLFGIPVESYGFSNNVRFMMRAPTFGEAAFLAPSGEASISIGLGS